MAEREDEAIRQRHFDDCRQLVDLAGPVERWVDLGSGAGFPALVVAIHRPITRVICIESDQRKAIFLREVIRQLSLNAEVLAQRIEDAIPLRAPVVSARALAPLDRLLDHVERHMAPDGEALLMKGTKWKEELELAQRSWHFSYEAIQSSTNPDAVVMKIKDLRRE